MSNLPHAAPAQLRVIGPLEAVTLVAGAMLGVGIFLNPRVVAAEVGSTPAFMVAWALGGLIALAGASTYLRLGRLLPRAGGDYVFIRAAFGPSAAFAAGWVLLAGVFAGSIASMTVAVCTYQLPVLWPGFVPDAPSVVPGVSSAQLGGVALIVLFTAINALGTRFSTRFQAAATIAPVLLLAAVAAWALVAGPDAAPASEAPVATPSLAATVVAVLSAQVPIYFAYAGWNAVGYVAGEVRDPERTLKAGLLGGTAVVTALYLLLCAGFVAVLGLGGVAQTFEVGTGAAVALFGPAAASWAAAVIALALVSTINGTTLGGGRVVWAMALDGVIARRLGQLTGPSQTPVHALVVQALAAIVLVCTGTFESLVNFTSIAMLVIGAAAVASWFRLRDGSGPVVLPAFYMVAASAVIAVKSIAAVQGDLAARLPLAGVAAFVALWVGHHLIRGRSSTR